jgi:amidohydrolase
MINMFKPYIDSLKEELSELSCTLYNNPELSGEEYESAKLHKSLLSKHGFIVKEINMPELETAFIGKFDSKKPGITIAYCAEYDALPSVGHGCGHNILGATSTGAAILLSKIINEIGGQVWLMGTPAEETYGGKIPMISAGFFQDVDIAMMAHPGAMNQVSGSTLAYHALEVSFHGKSSHAAADPEKGINALDAVMLMFSGINARREHLTDDVRIHGIILEGGAAPNIVPEFTKAKLYVRANNKFKADMVREVVYNIIKGAELMTGARAEISSFEHSFDDMNTNKVLSDVCTESMYEAGFDDINLSTDFKGSIDMGNVSYVVPSIHPFFDITNKADMPLHSKDFANATCTDFAKDQMMRMAVSLALTGYKVMSNSDLIAEIKEEFDRTASKK